MSTLQGESFYFHHGWHFLRADAFPMQRPLTRTGTLRARLLRGRLPGNRLAAVTLPHTFNDEDLFRDRIQDGGSGQRRTAAFYRNILTIPARHKNHKVLLAFEGLRQTCYLYVNGTLAGYYEAGVAPFGFDITPYVRTMRRTHRHCDRQHRHPQCAVLHCRDPQQARCYPRQLSLSAGAGRPRRPRGRPLFLELQRLQSLGRRHHPPRAGVFQAPMSI